MKNELQTAALCGKKEEGSMAKNAECEEYAFYLSFPTVSTHLVAQLIRRLAVCSRFSEEKSGHKGRKIRRPDVHN